MARRSDVLSIPRSIRSSTGRFDVRCSFRKRQRVRCRRSRCQSPRRIMKCQARSSSQAAEQGEFDRDGSTEQMLKVAGVVGAASAAAKVIGMGREMVLASCFGVGAVVDAFSYAFILPGFFSSLLGGINGPFHSAVASALMRTEHPREKADIVERVSSISFLVLLAASILTFVAARPLVDLAAPGLAVSGSEGLITRQVAILQLRIMAPSALFAGMTGICFGALAASGTFLLPAMSPAFSSISVLLSVAIYAASGRNDPYSGGIALAAGIMLGSVLQWLVQALLVVKSKVGNPFRLCLFDFRKDKQIMEILSVLAPAVVASGMLQIATYTDLYFASFLPHAAASLGYANLLVMAPLGIISSSMLVPILPMFAGLAGKKDWEGMSRQLKTALVISIAATLALSSVLIPLAEPIVKWVFQRKAFDLAASKMVIPLLICYSAGAPVYLARDVLVRAFYALGNGRTPFLVSSAAIATNAVLDWLLTRYYSLGAPGLVIATVSCNAASFLLLYRMLGWEVEEIGRMQLASPLLKLLFVSVISSFFTYLSHHLLRPWLTWLAIFVGKLSGHSIPSSLACWMADGVSICTAVLIGSISFLIIAKLLGVAEARLLIQTVLVKVRRVLGTSSATAESS